MQNQTTKIPTTNQYVPWNNERFPGAKKPRRPELIEGKRRVYMDKMARGRRSCTSEGLD